MDILFVVLLIALFAMFVSNIFVKERVRVLEERLDSLEAGRLTVERGQAPVLETTPAPAAAATSETPVTVTSHDWVPEPAPLHEEPHETLGGLFERWVAGRLLIWLGGIALVLAAIFLIRYSIEVGLITPAARMVGAGLFGLTLLAIGEWARVGRLADDPRIAQALVGAGLAILYATIYGSQILYALIGSRTAFAGMAVVTVAALGLSLRHGAPTAIMGLVGGFLTPLLVGSQSQTAPLLVYLALLDLALFALAWRRGWTWLAAAATVLSFAWTLWLVAERSAEDALLAGLFIAALAAAAALVRPGTGRQLALIQPLGLGLLQLAILIARTDVGAPAWALFGTLSLAAILLAAMRREHWPAPPAALAFALLLLLVKAGFGPSELVPAAAIGTGLLFGGAGFALARRAPAAMWTALAAAGLAGSWLAVRWLLPDRLTQTGWGALAVALALVPALLVWRQRDRARVDVPADLALLAAGAGFALLACAAVRDLAAPDWVAAGWLGIALLLALAARRLGDLALGTICVLVILCGAVRALWLVPELSSAWFQAILGVPVLAADLPGAARALAALAVPATLLAATRFALPPLPMRARPALSILAGSFAVAALYLWFKQAYGLTSHEDFVRRGLAERTLVTQALFLAGWLFGSGSFRLPRPAPDGARLAGTLLTAIATARLLWFDILLFNPALVDQWAGPLPLFNLIAADYLLGAIWLYLARRRAATAVHSWPWLAAFLLALVAATALLVRQYYHGAFLTGAALPNEAYGYSLAFLLVSIGLIVAGVRLPDKALRPAGLVLLTATIVKVFLVDAAALTGVLRILSFLVLGIALIGIGRLYGPILRTEREEDSGGAGLADGAASG
jgi:uncharacterized membrane protein